MITRDDHELAIRTEQLPLPTGHEQSLDASGIAAADLVELHDRGCELSS